MKTCKKRLQRSIKRMSVIVICDDGALGLCDINELL